MQLADFHLSDLIVRVVSAIVILIVTAFVASLLKKVLSKQLDKVAVLRRRSENGETLAASLGSIASLVVWLFGLMAILNLFQLTGVLTPIQGLLDSILSAVPRIIGAGLVLFIGIVLARIVRELLVTALQAANVDRWADKLGARANKELGTDDAGATATRKAGTPLLSTMIGQLAFAVIVLVVAIAALQVLGISAISDPATHMLSMILDAIPLIFGALILLGIGVVIAKFAGSLLETLLRGLGLNESAAKLGLDSARTDVAAILARVAQIGIVLFFAIAAANMLGSPQLSDILNTVLAIGGQVVFGAVIIAAGVFVANLVSGFLSGQTATIVRVATIILFAAMGLKAMGIADSIINLAFGALVVGGALAAALAFGLGGREAASRQLAKMQRDSSLR